MGQLWVGGTQRNGSLGLPAEADDIVSPLTQIPGDWVSVAHAGGAMVAVSGDGKLYTCGSDQYGLCGQGTEDVVVYELTQVGADTDWLKVFGATPYGVFYALKTNGTLWTWGNNGQSPWLGTNTAGGAPFEYHEPELVPGGAVYSGLVNVAAAGQITWLLFDDGRVFATGENDFCGFLDGDTGLTSYTFTEIPGANFQREGDGEPVVPSQICAFTWPRATIHVRGAASDGEGYYFVNGVSFDISNRLGWWYSGPGFVSTAFPQQSSWDTHPFIMEGKLWATNDFNGNNDYLNDVLMGFASAEDSWVRLSGCPQFSGGLRYVILDKNDGGLYGSDINDPEVFYTLVAPGTFAAEIESIWNADTANWGDGGTYVVLLAGEEAPVEPGEFWTAFVLTEEIE